MSEIILIEDLLDLRARKRTELEFYNKQLEELRIRMVFIKKEIDLTTGIIDMIEKEKMLDLKTAFNKKSKKRKIGK
jgi:hypothetical protein